MPIRPQNTSVPRLHWIAVMRRSNDAEADFKEAVCPPLRVIGVSQLGSNELTHCKLQPTSTTGCFHRLCCSRRRLLDLQVLLFPVEKKQKSHRHPLAGINSLSNFALASYLICAVVNKSGAAAVPKSDGFGEIRLCPPLLGAHGVGVA